MGHIKSDNEKLKRILRDVYQSELEKSPVGMGPKSKAIILAGPTCVGKTALSIKLASRLGGEIINADSLQVYQNVDVGSAKPTLSEQQLIPHHLIDIRQITDSFTAVDFYKEAVQICENIIARQKVPIIVGGAGFYLHGLLYGPPKAPPSDPEFRKSLEQELEMFSAEAMYDRLQKIDPEYAKTITSHDRLKIVRAFEIMKMTQKKVSDFPWRQQKEPPIFNYRCWFLFRARSNLYERINKRCDQMLQDRFLDEVLELKKNNVEQNRMVSHAIGYRQALEFLKTEQSDDDYQHFKEQFKRATRRYAKRQFTWFRKEPEFRWLDLDLHDAEIALDLIAEDYLSQDTKN